jgi:organic hydroperoxide reductase OsmC/OhrA
MGAVMPGGSAGAKTIPRVHAFASRVEWRAGTRGHLAADGKPSFLVASPPVFGGEPGLWTPQELLVAAVNACTMTTFLHFARRSNLPLVAYESEAVGTLEFVAGSYRFTRIAVRPRVTVSSASAVEAVHEAMRRAHERCPVGQSLSAAIGIDLSVAVAGVPPASGAGPQAP